jgi:hypothetical protein
LFCSLISFATKQNDNNNDNSNNTAKHYITRRTGGDCGRIRRP